MTFPSSLGSLLDVMNIKLLVDEIDPSHADAMYDRIKDIDVRVHNVVTSYPMVEQYSSGIEVDIRMIGKRIRQVPAWEIVLQWHNYHRTLMQPPQGELRLEDIQSNAAILDHLFDLLKLICPSVPHDVFPKDGVFDWTHAEKFVTAIQYFIDVPDEAMTPEDLC